jgi:hypothetical protein
MKLAQCTVKLSASRFLNIPRKKKFDDFTFIVGDCRYLCPFFVADFLSPKIAYQHDIEMTICEYVVETHDPQKHSEEIISLGRDGSLNLNSSNDSFVISLSEELDNEELLILILIEDESCESGEDIVIGRLCRPRRMNFGFGRDVEFAAKNFHKISTTSMKKLNVSILSMIMKSSELNIRSEDVHFENICELVECDREYFSLFEFVRFEWISTSNGKRFFDVVGSEMMASELSIGILRSFSRRHILPVPPTGVNDRVVYKGKCFVSESGSPICGIISSLSKIWG